MTHLRKLMLEELERRNYAASTTRAYLRAVDEFARYFNRPPDQLGPDHIRQYQAYLFREKKFQPNTVIQHLGGIRFFYIRTLKQSWSADLTPYPKKVLHLPSILSREEVNSLIEAAPTPFQRTLLMALYATGLRRAELARLKITDIDSGRSVIHVQGGKGRRDRDVMLSQNLLAALRDHCRSLRRKPAEWLFPGNRWHHRTDHPISPQGGSGRHAERDGRELARYSRRKFTLTPSGTMPRPGLCREDQNEEAWKPTQMCRRPRTLAS